MSGYFEQHPPRAELDEIGIETGSATGRILRFLIKVWIEAPVETRDQQGRKERTTRNKDEGKGTPQGSLISPLLSNIYMRRFIRGWKTGGHEQRLESYIVNYAGRLRDLLSRFDADEANGDDAIDDGQAQVDGERNKDANLCAPRRRV